MLDNIDNLIDIALSLNTSTPVFETLPHTQGQKLNSRASYYIVTQRKPQRIYVVRILYAAIRFLSKQ